MPKTRQSKRKIDAPTNVPLPLIPIHQLSNESIPAISILVQQNLVQDFLSQNIINPLMKKAEKAYIEKIAFDEEFIRIDKACVSSNTLPEQRFGPEDFSNIDYVKTPLQDVIDDFLKKVYDPALEKDQYWITGPSGTGKSFNFLVNVLKSRRVENNIILLHMTLYEQYLNQFANFFFNYLVYAFFPFLKDQSFPACPEMAQKTESPLKDWLLFILFEIQKNPMDLNCFSKFLLVAKMNLLSSLIKQIFIKDKKGKIKFQMFWSTF